MPIIADPSAPLIPASLEGERLWRDQIAPAVEDAWTVFSTVQDNDAETWMITPAGQIVQVCGLCQDRFYLWNPEAALEYLRGIAEDSALLEAWTQDEINAFDAQASQARALLPT